MLWNIYRNDLFYIQLKGQLSAYADDHQLYYAHEDPEQAEIGINNDGKQTSSRYSENFLQGNLSKYQAMVISKYIPLLDIVIDSVKIKLTKDLKLLGVVIDRSLLFSEYISAACKKASTRVGVLIRFRKLISIKAKLSIYKVAILLYLTYSGLVCHFCKGSDRRKLERVNERGLRTVFCDWNSSYSELLSRARLTSLFNRRL